MTAPVDMDDRSKKNQQRIYDYMRSNWAKKESQEANKHEHTDYKQQELNTPAGGVGITGVTASNESGFSGGENTGSNQKGKGDSNEAKVLAFMDLKQPVRFGDQPPKVTLINDIVAKLEELSKMSIDPAAVKNLQTMKATDLQQTLSGLQGADAKQFAETTLAQIRPDELQILELE